MVHDEIFSPSFGNRPSYLVGRQDIMTSLIEGLRSAPGSKGRAVVLLGQRGAAEKPSSSESLRSGRQKTGL